MAKAKAAPRTIKLEALSVGDTFLIPGSQRTGKVLRAPSPSSVLVRLWRTSDDPDVKATYEDLHIGPGTEVLPTSRSAAPLRPVAAE